MKQASENEEQADNIKTDCTQQSDYESLDNAEESDDKTLVFVTLDHTSALDDNREADRQIFLTPQEELELFKQKVAIVKDLLFTLARVSFAIILLFAGINTIQNESLPGRERTAFIFIITGAAAIGINTSRLPKFRISVGSGEDTESDSKGKPSQEKDENDE
jgi:hypothetical protein